MLGKEVTYADPAIQQCIEGLRDRLTCCRLRRGKDRGVRPGGYPT